MWKNCAPGQEHLFERWYHTEHLAERAGVPGFRCGWPYEAFQVARRNYFTSYETDAPRVLVLDVCKQRLDSPTPLGVLPERRITATGRERSVS